MAGKKGPGEGSPWNSHDVYQWDDRDSDGRKVTRQTTVFTLKGTDPKRVAQVTAEAKEDAIRGRYGAGPRLKVGKNHPGVREGRPKKKKKDED